MEIIIIKLNSMITHNFQNFKVITLCHENDSLTGGTPVSMAISSIPRNMFSRHLTETLHNQYMLTTEGLSSKVQLDTFMLGIPYLNLFNRK